MPPFWGSGPIWYRRPRRGFVPSRGGVIKVGSTATVNAAITVTAAHGHRVVARTATVNLAITVTAAHGHRITGRRTATLNLPLRISGRGVRVVSGRTATVRIAVQVTAHVPKTFTSTATINLGLRISGRGNRFYRPEAFPVPPTWRILVRDATMAVVGEIGEVESFEATLKFNDVGKWSLACSLAQPGAAALLEDGAGIILLRDGVAKMSGTCEAAYEIEDPKGGDWLEAEGASDWKILATAVVRPPTGQSHYVDNGGGSSVIINAIRYAIGDTAIPSKQRKYLHFRVDPVTGAPIKGQLRYDRLSGAVKRLASQAGNLNVTVLQDPALASREIAVEEPRDRTGEMFFSLGLGNLTKASLKHSAPAATDVEVLGRGEADQRGSVAATADAATLDAWDVREVVTSHPERPTADLPYSLTEELNRLTDTREIDVEVADNQAIDYGTRYEVGDIVSAWVRRELYAAFVTEVKISAKGKAGWKVRPKLKTSPFAPSMGRDQLLLDLQERVERVERNVETATPGAAILWSGSVATIPATWELANGSGSPLPPDFRDRVVMGAGTTYANGSSGGAASYSLVTHSHTLSGSATGSLSVSIPSLSVGAQGVTGVALVGFQDHTTGDAIDDLPGVTSGASLVGGHFHHHAVSGHTQTSGSISSGTTVGGSTGTASVGTTGSLGLSGSAVSNGGATIPTLPPYRAINVIWRAA